jgi:opacity protein-like surface antigen
MKNKSLLLLLLLIAASYTTQAQGKLFAGTGTTFSSVPGNEFKLKNQFGYYASFGITDNIRKRQSASTELQFIDQRCKNDLVKFRSNTIALSAYYRYQPLQKFKLQIMGGVQMGFISYSKIQAADMKIKDRDVKFSGVAGLSYPINRYEITTRYNYRFDGNEIFKAPSFQLGVNYRL